MAADLILILGGGFMQFPAIRTARALGYRVLVADANPTAEALGEADIFEHVDLADPPGMLAMARRYHEAGLLRAVFTAGTDFSATVAYVAEHLGLPGHSYEAALNASIKSRMRTVFEAQGIPSPRFRSLEPGAGLKATEVLNLPLVVKPVDNMGARGVRKVLDRATLGLAVEDARRHSRSGTVIVEEFIEGPEYSIDSLVFDGRVHPRGLARRHIHFPPYFIELGHTLPSDLSPEQADDLVRVFSQAVKALGLSHGAAKGDVFYTSRGPVIGEIAARLSGGYMSGWTYPLASGVDLTREALLLALGQKPSLAEESRGFTSVERALVSIPGRVASIAGLDQARAVEWVDQVVLRARAGSEVVFPVNNVQKAGNIIVAAPDRDRADTSARAVQDLVTIGLEPCQPLTDAWLQGPVHHPASSGPESSSPAAYWTLASIAPTTLPSDWDAVRQALELGAPIPFRPLPEIADNQESCPWDRRPLGRVIEVLTESGLLTESTRGLGRAFLQVLAKGGLQGGRYLVESLRSGGEATLQSWAAWEVHESTC